MSQENQKQHTPVLLEEVIATLKPVQQESYLDLTAGYGGHAEAVLMKTQAPGRAVLVDRDANSTRYLKATQTFQNTRVMRDDFLNVARNLRQKGEKFHVILADLGVSSQHLDNPSRGFSINSDGPLDMRMDQRQELSASDIVNTYSGSSIEKILREFGEEPKARKIAALITSNRPIQTTGKLAQVVSRAWPGRSKIHPATRTFQALRIAVNNELGLLEAALPIWAELLEEGGRLGVISFHSLEDRIVKQYFVEQSKSGYEAELTLLTKKPILASKTEIAFNPRARSAKLRAVAKIKTKGRRD